MSLLKSTNISAVLPAASVVEAALERARAARAEIDQLIFMLDDGESLAEPAEPGPVSNALQ